MLTILSVITAVKDYVEIVHKLIETDSSNFTVESLLTNYSDLGAIVTYSVLVVKHFLTDVLSFRWLQSIYSIPVIVPNIASAMVSEISVLDGYFHNAFTFLETPISYGNNNFFVYCLEKFVIGILNSLFLFLPTSTAHLICIRRFVMQGFEAGYIAGLGTIAGNMVWIGSLIFGLRFLIIPWLSLDILRYILGFILLVKYMWDSYSEKRVVLEDLSKKKIFLLNFLLAFTEQTNIYPFMSNLSISSDSTFLESFPADTLIEFVGVHGSYLLGIFLGSFSLLQLTCWFWENPAYKLYMWMISSAKVTTSLYYKVLNFIFLYLTMICAISSVSYFALDYTLTNPLGFVYEDRLLEQKGLLETSFLNTKASDRNTRRNRGRHGRRERWKRRIRRYRTFDASLYDQGVYDLFTIEDLNYGFDRFWLRRKMRNHRVHFRFFPGPWMRSFKKQLSRPRLESFMGPRVEFFRILFEQVYHPEFHEFKKNDKLIETNKQLVSINSGSSLNFSPSNRLRLLKESIYSNTQSKTQKQGFIKEYSALRKFVRKMDNRVKISAIELTAKSENSSKLEFSDSLKPIYSKRWKFLFSKMSHQTINSRVRQQENLFRRLYKNVLLNNVSSENNSLNVNPDIYTSEALLLKINSNFNQTHDTKGILGDSSKKKDSLEKLSKKDRQILRYKTFLNQKTSLENVLTTNNQLINNDEMTTKTNIETLNLVEKKSLNNLQNKQNRELTIKTQSKKTNSLNILNQIKTIDFENQISNSKALSLLHPIKFYLKKEQAFQRKFKFYGANIYRTFGIENNAPYFRTMMRRFFYYYKPTLRWEKTMHMATMRKARRKGPRVVRKLNIDQKVKGLSSINNFAQVPEKIYDQNIVTNEIKSNFQKPTHFYSLVSKRASRYRSQIYKDVLQHWYYTPFNRLLLKFDVDSFIRRQPTAYFLTKQEEQLLHFRRFLLSEYYETLRWYTYMQHYSSMKAKIGGTKSFSSRMYSQQFMGTFKKVRHLFAITPNFSENTILKFDQPLYNEYSNNQTSGILADSLIHEELLADDDLSFVLVSKNSNLSANIGNDLTDQSTKIIREYLTKAKPLREQIMRKLLAKKNYWEFTKFLFKGQKIRGTAALTNQKSFLIQEKDYLYTPNEKLELQKSKKQQLEKFFKQKTTLLQPDSFASSFVGNLNNNNKLLTNSLTMSEFQQNLWIELLKKCQNQLYDQESLKTYLLHHVEKRKKQQQRQEKYLKLRLQRLENWFLGFQTNEKNSNKQNVSQLNGLTTAIQKGMKESVLYQNGYAMFPVKSNIRNNLPEIQWSLNQQTRNQNNRVEPLGFNVSKNIVLNNSLKEHLVIRLKNKQNLVYQIEQNLKTSLKNLQDVSKNEKFKDIEKEVSLNTLLNNKQTKENSLIEKALKPFSYLSQLTKNTFSFTLETTKNYSLKTKNQIIKPIFLLKNFLNPKNDLDMKYWRKQEIALAKRKKTRKILKRLKNTNQRTSQSSNTNFSTNDLLNYRSLQSMDKNQSNFRQKIDAKEDSLNFENQKRVTSWNEWLNTKQSNQSKNERSEQKKTIFSRFEILTKNHIVKKFKRKRSRLRRYRRLKSRGPIKKRTLGEKLKRQFKLLKRYSLSSDSVGTSKNQVKTDKKVEIFQLITKRKYEPQSEFVLKDTKQRRTRVIKRRFWRKHKKQKYAQNKRKERKRRRYAAGKIRNLFKNYKKKKANVEIKQWWWQSFLPNFKATMDINWQIQIHEQIQRKFNKLSSADILERDQLNFQLMTNENFNNSKTVSTKNENLNLDSNILQIGDKDYKPLALPEAIRIREKLANQKNQNFNSVSENLEKFDQITLLEKNKKTLNNENDSNLDLIGKVTQNTFIKESSEQLKQLGIEPASKLISSNQTKFLMNLNPIPFYAGWDESVRKFVVTNRLLSSQYQNSLSNPVESKKQIAMSNFDRAPLKGMNAATTLYWQVPFTTYDPDQFFALGMDGFSPIGWRKFHFRHSKQTTKPILVQNKIQTDEYLTNKQLFNKSNFSTNIKLTYNLQQKIFSQTNPFYLKSQQKTIFKDSSKISSKNQLRRSQKRYKRVKKHPRPPVWFPSGPLTNQVLPVHYIYVFYKRYRLPRDRYIRRRLRRNKENSPASIRESFTKYTDFTLRKRAKPRRKYHRKRHFAKTQNLLLKRRAFRGLMNEPDLSRPKPLNFVDGQNEQRFSKFSNKQKRKLSAKQSATDQNLRIRQLRRRIQRQVIRPVWRYKPRAGGWAWPGDYLRLELVKAPILSLPQDITTFTKDTDTKVLKARKTKKKKRKTIQEWQIQPKKYLLQKHNLKVLKKRLEKSQNSHKMFQRSRDLTYLFNKNE